MKFRVGKKRSCLPNATVASRATILGEPMEDLIATKTRGVMAYQGRDALQPGDGVPGLAGARHRGVA